MKTLGPGRVEPCTHAMDDGASCPWCELANVKAELAWLKQKYDWLNQIYTKLADTWNAFQATAHLQPRDVQRAEAAGEVTRRQAYAMVQHAYPGTSSEHSQAIHELAWNLLQLAYRPPPVASDRALPDHEG